MPKRGFLYAGITLYIASFILALPFPNNMNTYAQLSVLSIPLQTTDGLYGKGIFALVLLLGAIACLIKSVSIFKAAAVIVPLVLYLVLPSVMIPMYQAYIAQGIYALSYDQEQAGCQLTTLNDGAMQLYCELPMKNYSDKQVEVGVEFVGDDEVSDVLNTRAPYRLTVDADEETVVVIDTTWTNDSGIERVLHATSPAIRFVDGDKKRTM